MSETARALWFDSPGICSVHGEILPDPGPGTVRVRARFGAISRGTEGLILRGGVPENQRQVMRAPFQEGEFTGPVKYGYINVGEVETGPRAGTAVLCLYPHQDRYVVPEDAAVPLPAGVPPSRAVLGPNFETALNAVWDAGVSPGDRVAVVGGGVVGCLVAYLCRRIVGCDVTLVDIRPARATVAAALGFAFALPDRTPTECDVVFHASGHAAGLATALAAAGLESTVVEMSWYGDTPVPAPLGEGFHSRRLRLISSQVGHVQPHRQPRWTRRRRLEKALELLSDPALETLINSEGSFDNLSADLPRVVKSEEDVLCHRIVY